MAPGNGPPRLGVEVVPLAGGYSGETFLVSTGGDQAVLRLYVRQPERAAIDLALLERLHGLVPVPAVLDAVTVGAPDQPPFLLLEALPGDRGDLVLPAADAALRRRIGAAVAGVLVLLGTVRFPRHGQFRDAQLDPVAFAGHTAGMAPFLAAHLDRPWFAGRPRDEIESLRAVATAADDLTEQVFGSDLGVPSGGRAGFGQPVLVHSDFNPKNLLLDPATGGVTGVVDWEYAYAGSTLADLGNLLRFETDPEFAGAVVQTYRTFAPSLPDAWLDVARALDLTALIDLAARDQADGDNAVVRGARELLVRTARTGELAAGRPDPEAGLN